MDVKRILLGLVFFVLGASALWNTTRAVRAGEILDFAKHDSTIFHKATEPGAFWLYVGLWAVFGALGVASGVWVVLKREET